MVLDYLKIGTRIKKARIDKKLTQAQLAEMCGKGVSTNHIQRVETGNSGCSVDVLIDIANSLNIPLYKLFEFKD